MNTEAKSGHLSSHQSGYERLSSVLQQKAHVIWDWNGTLLNDVDHSIDTVNHLLESHSLAKINRERYQQVFDFPIRKYYDRLGFDYTKESFESLCHRYVDRFMSKVNDLPLVEGMEAVVRKLHSLGVKQSVLSATDQPNLDRMISHFKLEDVFSHVFGIQDKFAASKVESGHKLLRVAGADRNQTVIVGDTLHDLEVANELGIHAVLVAHGHHCANRLREHHSEVYIL